MIAAVLFDEGPLSRSDPWIGQSESWPDPGRPGSADEAGWLKVERREAQRLCRRARAALHLGRARRVR